MGQGAVAQGKKNARRRGAWIVFEDESGISLTPPVRRTWAPVGHTPVITAKFNWKRLSMAGAVAYSPDGGDAAVVFQTKAGAYNDESLTVFLDQLHEFLGRARVTLLWDGLPSHRSRLMNDYRRANRSWLVVERLPAYAPELNPVEALWGNLKGTELANRCVQTIEDVETIAHGGAVRIGEDAELAFAFLRHTGLSL